MAVIEDVPDVVSPSEGNDVELVLERAEAWIREHGWTQGMLEDETGAVCLAGAIRRGCGMSPSRWARRGSNLYERAYNQVSKAVGGRSVASWNDGIYRSEAEALEVLRTARNPVR